MNFLDEMNIEEITKAKISIEAILEEYHIPTIEEIIEEHKIVNDDILKTSEFINKNLILLDLLMNDLNKHHRMLYNTLFIRLPIEDINKYRNIHGLFLIKEDETFDNFIHVILEPLKNTIDDLNIIHQYLHRLKY